MVWRIHHKSTTKSTNEDARAGSPGDVYTADFQTAGRGRLNHTWLSAPGENLMLSAVLGVEGLSPEHVATLPLVVGLSVLEGVAPWSAGGLELKWPNDVLLHGRKLSGILCERHGDKVIAGVGVNVNQRTFAPDVADRATSLAQGPSPQGPSVESVRDAVLAALARNYDLWRSDGFAAVYPRVSERDSLRGRSLAVLRTDDDTEPLRGLCGGILPDGSLDVGGVPVYAGEAHILRG